jgi:uncharacterized protein YcfL
MLKIALGYIFILMLAGCSSSDFVPSWQYKIKNTSDSIKVIELSEFLSQSKLLQVSFNVKNGSNITKKFRYKIVWFDNQKQPIDTLLSNWKNVAISGNNNVYLSVIAPNENAVNYKVLIN